MKRWIRYQDYENRLDLPPGGGFCLGLNGLSDSHALGRDRAAKSRSQGWKSLGGTVVLSLLLHLAVLFPMLERFFERSSEVNQVTKVVYRGPSKATSHVKRLRAESIPKSKSAAKTKEEREADEPPINGQVVQLPAPEKIEKPKDARYLSEWDQKTERETRSRYQTNQFENPTRKPQIGHRAKEKPKPVEVREKHPQLMSDRSGGPKGEGNAADGHRGEDSDTGGKSPEFVLQLPRQTFRSPLHLDFRIDGTMRNRDAVNRNKSDYDALRLALGGPKQNTETPESTKLGPGEGQSRRGGAGHSGLPSLMQLTPTLAELEKALGMPANDYLPEVETDAETRLNAWRWKHTPFFNRMADGLRSNWEGPSLLKERDPTSKIYGTADINTVLHVAIDSSGNLVSISVRDSSGVPFFDEEAIRTFRATAPFTNPPQGLFRDRERFVFDFGFHVSYRNQQIDFDWRPY